MKLLMVLLVAFLGFSAFAEDDAGLEAILEGTRAKTTEKKSPKNALRLLVDSRTPEQDLFFDSFEAGDLEKALSRFAPAFNETKFGKTANGKALLGLVLFQNGFPLTGLDELLALDPNDIHHELLKVWKQTATEDHPVWTRMWVKSWNPKWTPIFGVNQEIRVFGKTMNGFQDIEQIKALLSKSIPGSLERNQLQWQLVLGLSINDTPKAGQALAHLMKQPNLPVSMGLMDLTAARMLYQNGYLDAAIKYYQKVPKDSDEWFEAQEEMAWSYLRKGQSQDTIAITQVLNQPSMAWLSGPEASFLRALAQLKVCDYKGVVKTLENFKDFFKDRTGELVKLSKDANVPEVEELGKQRSEGPIPYSKIGSALKKLPRTSLRDIPFGNLALFYSGLNAEAKRAGIPWLQQMVEQRSLAVRAAMISRVQFLANEEVEEVQDIISKLQIVEAEMIQQSMVLEKMASRGFKSNPVWEKGRIKTEKYQIEFPASDEIWFDEFASYNLDIKGGCEGVKR